MPSLSQSLQEQLRAYVRGDAVLDDLRDWLEDHVQAVAEAESEEPGVWPFSDEVWLLVSEYDSGDRTEVDLKQALMELVVQQPAFKTSPSS